MARSRDIQTNQLDISCDVCGRTLLRGEHPETFLAGGARRQVCDLCTTRAQHEGWIRESGADELTLRHTRSDGRGRSFLERLRGRRERAREVHEELTAAASEEPARPERPARREAPRRPRHVHAVPTNADLKVQRAVEVFNGTDHTRTVAGVARSLGPPEVCVRPLLDRPSVVSIAVMWELSWYRFEVDLSDEAGGVRRDAQGDELDQLPGEDRAVNAAADERGRLHIA
jgi:hypothetical protein